MNRNPLSCPHNITATDPPTNDEYCTECGLVMEPEEEDWLDVKA